MWLLALLAFTRVFRGSLRQITMTTGKPTTSKKGEVHNQVECYSDPRQICAEYGPKAIRCNNSNPANHPDPKWNCEPIDWSIRHQIVESQINCEGWDKPDDSYVVQDSCYIKIRMIYDRVQVHVDRSPLSLLIPLVFIAVGVLIVITAFIWYWTYGKEREVEEKPKQE